MWHHDFRASTASEICVVCVSECVRLSEHPQRERCAVCVSEYVAISEHPHRRTCCVLTNVARIVEHPQWDQCVVLHLSEHDAPHAVESFLFELYVKKFSFSSLKAITFRDVPVHIYDSLIDNFLPFLNLKSLSIDLNNGHYHYWDYATGPTWILLYQCSNLSHNCLHSIFEFHQNMTRATIRWPSMFYLLSSYISVFDLELKSAVNNHFMFVVFLWIDRNGLWAEMSLCELHLRVDSNTTDISLSSSTMSDSWSLWIHCWFVVMEEKETEIERQWRSSINNCIPVDMFQTVRTQFDPAMMSSNESSISSLFWSEHAYSNENHFCFFSNF